MTIPTGQATRQTIIARRFKHLAAPIIPLLSTTTMSPHPNFPRTLLAYHLLSSTELDTLAVYYHQSSPKSESWTYPAPVANRWRLTSSTSSSSSSSSTSSSTQHEKNYLRRRQRRRQAATHLWKNIVVAANPPPPPPSPRSDTSTAPTTTSTPLPPEPPFIDTPRTTEDKRRRFGRFIGLQGCESPGMTPEEMERDTGEAVRIWVEEEIERRMAREKRAEEGRRKGAW